MTVRLPVADKALANAIVISLKPETIYRTGVRSITEIKTNHDVVELAISASDLVSLRAAANSFLRFILATVNTIEAVSAFNKTEKSVPLSKVGSKNE